MDLRDEKRKLIESVINKQVTRPNFETHAKEIGTAAPQTAIARWKRNFYAPVEMAYPTEPRLMNRFMVGADPEFIFVGKGVGKDYVYASNLGLNTLEAFGADMNGRLAELRAYPSRFVIEVVASLAETLQWLAVAHPDTMKFEWRAPAYAVNVADGRKDGVGGHIHLGRKKQDSVDVIKSLDKLTALLVKLGCVDTIGNKERCAQTNYGKPGDVRLQDHGYEYRTMPTWMANPWSAFLTLTLAKLCVFHPLSQAKLSELNVSNYHIIRNMLLAYQGQDDDARIALVALNRLGLPIYNGSDMRVDWGVLWQTGKLPNASTYFPPVIKPSLDTMKAVFDYLVKGERIPGLALQATWSPFALKNGVTKIHMVAHVPGLPELLQGLLAKDFEVHFMGDAAALGTAKSGNATYLNVSRRCNFDWERGKAEAHKWGFKLIDNPAPAYDKDSILIYTPSFASNYVVNKEKVWKFRQFLLTPGLFPIAKYKEVETLDTKSFHEVKKKYIPKQYGSIVSQIEGQRGG